MWSPKSTPSVDLLPDLLEKMPMLFFAGDADLMCNWMGIQDTIINMTWKGAQGFGNATDEEWHVNGTQAGTWQTARNMTFVKVFEAGHMVSNSRSHRYVITDASCVGPDRPALCGTRYAAPLYWHRSARCSGRPIESAVADRAASSRQRSCHRQSRPRWWHITGRDRTAREGSRRCSKFSSGRGR